MLSTVRYAIAGFAVLVVAACNGTTSGQPTTADPMNQPRTTGSNPPATTAPTPSFVERPREISLDDLNPCDLWTEAQLRELGVHPEPRRGDPKPNLLGNITCGYDNAPPTVDRPPVEIGYTAITVLNAGIESEYDDEPAAMRTIIEIGGFPAVEDSEQRGVIDPCGIYIGTADGQHLRIRLSTLWPNEHAPEEACQMARTAAEMAITTLQELR